MYPIQLQTDRSICMTGGDGYPTRSKYREIDLNDFNALASWAFNSADPAIIAAIAGS